MLVEIRVRDLGVIDDLDLVLGPGMTALTGETGAGKTLVVEALELLVGGRADATLVRRGADQAVVEGRFSIEAPETTIETPETPGKSREVVVSREIPADGRSRAYLDGRMATVAALAEAGEGSSTCTASTVTSPCFTRTLSAVRWIISAAWTSPKSRPSGRSSVSWTSVWGSSAATIGNGRGRSTSSVPGCRARGGGTRRS